MFALLALAACTRPVLPEPQLERSVPSFAWNGDAAALSLQGSDFWPEIEIDSRRGTASINPTYRARLVGPEGEGTVVPLVGVGIVDDEELTATVPAGLEPGSWTLEVITPRDEILALPGGFRITDQQASKVVLGARGLVFTAGTQAVVDLRLVDLDDEVVPLPFEVVVVGTSPTGPVTLSQGTLEEVRPTPSGDGIRGNLVDGRAEFEVSVTAPGRVNLVTAPGDPYAAVVGDSLSLLFEPGADLAVELTLPAGPFVAGQPFEVAGQVIDQYGNPVADPTPVTLRTTCSGWVGSVVLSGATTFEVVPTIASTPSCGQDELVVVEPNTLTGRSQPFEVLPGPTTRLSVLAGPLVVQAGDELNIVVLPLDDWGNRSVWPAAVTLTDSVAGLVEPACFPVGDYRLCTARLTRASAGVTVTVTGDDGVSGVSPPIDVVPGDTVARLDVRTAAVVTAGVGFSVGVSALDEWGNLIAAADTSDTFTVTDELGDGLCDRVGTGVDGSASFDCTLLIARPDALLTGSLDGTAASTALVVQNGALADVQITVPTATTAGSVVDLQVEGRDAYGNLYLVQGDLRVALVDDAGSIDPIEVLLDTAALASTNVQFRVAGPTTVRAYQGGLELGQSPVVTVTAGPTTGLQLTVEPWVWVGEGTPVTLESVDGFGNRTDLDGIGTLTSRNTPTGALAVPMVNGVGSSVYTWTAAAIPDVLDASLAGFVGMADVVVVRRCAQGPDAVLTFGGEPDGVACETATDGGALVADLSGSLRGAVAVSQYAASVNGAPAVLDGSGLVPLVLPALGEHVVRGLAIDTASCGDEVAASAWSAPDDGTPAGDLELQVSVGSLPVLGVATLDVVGVEDCRRAPAALQELLVSTTGGSLANAVPTGEGLALTLDPLGNGTTPLDTSAGGLQDTQLEIVAATRLGTARGSLLLPLTGDVVRPVVLALAPSGASLLLEDTFVFTLSEPPQLASITTGNFLIGGVAPASVSVSGAEVTASFPAPLDGSLGPWVVTVASGVRDVAGNRLSGDWSSGSAIWQSAWGGSTAAPAAPTCGAVTPSSLRFRPDGDDGPAEESDLLTVELTAGAAPAWWVLEVFDDLGGLVFTDWEVPVTATDQVSWNGRRLDGTIAPGGRYELEFSAADGLGNRSLPCAVSASLEAR